MKPLLSIMTRLGNVAVQLHGILLKRWLGSMGTDCHVELGVRFVGHDSIRIGNRCYIARNVDIFAGGNVDYPVDLGNDVRIREGCYIDSHGGWIRLADKVFLGPQCMVYGHGGLSIGRNTMVAGQTAIVPANHKFSRTDIPLRDQGEMTKGIVIENDVWIGSCCTILDGVRIGHDAVIGAGSVVTRDIPPFAVAVGIPARVTKDRRSND
jgi:galactoside O-acetyltransferase